MEPIIICFFCRQHVSHADLLNGQHNHVDERDRLKTPAETKLTS